MPKAIVQYPRNGLLHAAVGEHIEKYTDSEGVEHVLNEPVDFAIEFVDIGAVDVDGNITIGNEVVLSGDIFAVVNGTRYVIAGNESGELTYYLDE